MKQLIGLAMILLPVIVLFISLLIDVMSIYGWQAFLTPICVLVYIFISGLLIFGDI